MKIALVTATTDIDRSAKVRHHWPFCFPSSVDIYTVCNGLVGTGGGWQQYGSGNGGRRLNYYTSDFLGVVPAFAIGVQKALEDGAEIIACLHDDLEIQDYQAGETIYTHFLQHPRCGLVGFGGGTGLGDSDIYQKPYAPGQLARKDFISNMRDAEAHGRRVTVPTQVACLDGFSQIGRREFWEGLYSDPAHTLVAEHLGGAGSHARLVDCPNLFSLMQSWGVVHHAYDAALGAFAARLGWEVWYLPIAVHHLGGQTAVGDARYAEWARTQNPDGDAGFWEAAHRIVYDQFRDVLPVRLPTGI